MQPSSRLGWSKTIEAPFRGRFVESRPRPFDDDERTTVVKAVGDLPDELTGILHVVNRVTGDHGIDRAHWLIRVKLDLFIASTSRRHGINPYGVIPGELQRGDETTRWPTADFEKPSRSSWQVNPDQRPECRQPSFL